MRSFLSVDVLILAGGKGTRMGSITEKIPKPMVRLGSKPMILRIMESYSIQGFKSFIILTGYKQEIFKDYFSNLLNYGNDIQIDYSKNKINFFSTNYSDWKVKVIFTGIESNTGERIKKAQKFIETDLFHITYGDGLSNVNLQNLIRIHRESDNVLTLTAINPPTKFGELKLKDNIVESFEEKPKLSEGFINGGFMVSNTKLFKYLGNNQMLEREPMQRLAKENNLGVYKHNGYWQCFDTAKDISQFKEKN